jgi:hypothetical protein
MVASLPMTVAARRNARLQSAALATIPLVLFVAAAIPRVWAPGLVPFDEPRAAYVSEAVRRSPAPPWAIYAHPSLPTLALVEPLLQHLPAPVAAWVVLRGLLDALGVALLYLAARSLVSVGPALVAALLYGANPLAWDSARDPSGALGAVIAAAILLAAARFARRRTVPRGVMLAAVLVLLGVPAALRTGFDPHAVMPSLVMQTVSSVLTVMMAVVPFLLVLPTITCRFWPRWGGVAAAGLFGLLVFGVATELTVHEKWQSPFATLREWSALADAVRETTARVGTNEVVLPDERSTALSAGQLQALLGEDVTVRRVPATLLPSERETVFVLAPGAVQTVELQRASSLTTVSTSDGTDTGARIVTLRPRAESDWLARLPVIPDARFEDGSKLVGVTPVTTAPDRVAMLLYWELPAASDGRAIAMAGNVRGQADAASATGASFELPSVEARRSGELVVTKASLVVPGDVGADGRVVVSLRDANGRPVRTIGGQASFEITVSLPPR